MRRGRKTPWLYSDDGIWTSPKVGLSIRKGGIAGADNSDLLGIAGIIYYSGTRYYGGIRYYSGIIYYSGILKVAISEGCKTKKKRNRDDRPLAC